MKRKFAALFLLLALLLAVSALADTQGLLTLPAGTTVIEEEAFAGLTSATEFDLPASVTQIGAGAFRGAGSGSAQLRYYFPTEGLTVAPGAFDSCRATVKVNGTELPRIYYTVSDSGATVTGSGGNLTDVVIPDTLGGKPVVAIGKDAFSGQSAMTRVVVPDTVVSLGASAFRDCSSLTQITLPAGITALPNSVFQGDRKLEQVNLQGALTAIGNDAFNDCYVLAFDIPATVTQIGDYAFRYCRALTQATIPSGVTALAKGIFTHCENLQSVQLPQGLQSIGQAAFDYCVALTGIDLPTGLTSLGTQVFYDCRALTSVSLPAGITALPSETFRGCYALTQVDLPTGLASIGSNVFYDCQALRTVSLPAGVTALPNDAFRYWTGLTDIQLPSGLTTLGTSVFRDCRALTSISLPAGITTLPNDTFYNCSALAEISLPTGLTALGTNVFYYCTALTEISLPAGVTALPNETFCGCYALADIDLTRITSLGSNVFRECRALTEVTIPEGVTALPQSAFEGDTGLQQVHLPSTLTTINNYAFYNCKALTEIAIPAGVTAIPDGAFQKCAALQSVQLPAGVESIAQNAFRECTKLTQINFPAGLTSIGNEAFRDTCVDQAANAVYVLPDSVETFGSSAFYNCGAGLLVAKGSERENFVKTNGYTFTYDANTGFRYQYKKVNSVDTLYLTAYKGPGGSVTIPAEAAIIGENAFANNTAVTAVTIPNTVTALDKQAFRYCTSLARVTMADSVTLIDERAFAYCANLTDVTFSANLTSIGADAFDYACTAAGTHFYRLPDHIATLGWTPFSDCGAVMCFTRGSDTAALFRSNNNTSSILYTYAGETDFRYRWYNNEGTEGHQERLMQYVGSAATVNIPPYVWMISDDAFRNNTAVTKVVIPEGVTHIYANAFRDCANLTDITLPDTLHEIRDNAFYGCGSAAATDFTLELPANIEIANPGAFTAARMILICGLDTTTAHSISNRGYSFVRADRPTELDFRYRWDYFDHVWNWGLYDYAGSLSSVLLPDDCRHVNSAMFQQKPDLELKCNQLSDTALGLSEAGLNFTFPGHEGLRYRIIENVLYVMGWAGTGTALNIPKATAYIDAGWDEQIRSAAFVGNEALAKAVIPEGVTRINADAFSGCVNLTDITLPDSLKSMDQKVFRYAGQNLSEPFYLVLPDHMEDLMGRNGGANSFEDLNAVLVCGKTSQTAALVSDRNYCYTVAGEYDFRYRYEIPTNYSSRELWLVGYEGEDAQVTIPSGIYGVRRFNGNTTDSNWPTFHGDGFYGNVTVTKVVIPEGAVVLEDSAFRGCVNLTDISFPNTLKVIKNHAVQECGSASQTLHYYVLPDNMEEISTTTANDWGAFNDINMGRVSCNPGTTTALQLSGIDTYNHNGSYLFALKGHETDGLLYQYRQYTVNGEPVNRLELRQYEGSGTAVYIPAGTGLYRIENNVFKDHQEPLQVTMPDGLVEIGDSAFSGCTLLHGGAEEFVIRVPSTVKRIQNNAFYEVGSGYTANRFYLVLPGALEEFYISAITNCNAVFVAPGGLAAQELYNNWYYYYTTLADAKAKTNCLYQPYIVNGVEVQHDHYGKR